MTIHTKTSEGYYHIICHDYSPQFTFPDCEDKYHMSMSTFFGNNDPYCSSSLVGMVSPLYGNGA